MNCPRCGSVQQDAARFCGVCGSPLPTAPPTPGGPAPVAAPPAPAPQYAPAPPAYVPPTYAQPPQYMPPQGYAPPPAYAPPAAYPPGGFAPAPGYAPAPGSGAAMMWQVVAGVFTVLGLLGSIGGAILSGEGDHGTAAVVYVFAAIFWMLAAVGFFLGKRASAPRYAPAYGPPPPR